MTTPLGTLAGIVRSIASAVPRVHPGGYLPIGTIAAGTLAGRALLRACGMPRSARFVTRSGAALTVASTLFFREPTRVPPTDSHIVVAPADGVVTAIESATPP